MPLEILGAPEDIRFGSIEVVIHDRRVVQIEREEKSRLAGDAVFLVPRNIQVFVEDCAIRRGARRCCRGRGGPRRPAHFVLTDRAAVWYT